MPVLWLFTTFRDIRVAKYLGFQKTEGREVDPTSCVPGI